MPGEIGPNCFLWASNATSFLHKLQHHISQIRKNIEETADSGKTKLVDYPETHLIYSFNSQLVATRQKSSCSFATSKGESRHSGSTFSLLTTAVERLGFEAWRRMEPEEMQLGTCGKSSSCKDSHWNDESLHFIIMLSTCRVVFTSLL